MTGMLPLMRRQQISALTPAQARHTSLFPAEIQVGVTALHLPQALSSFCSILHICATSGLRECCPSSLVQCALSVHTEATVQKTSLTKLTSFC